MTISVIIPSYNQRDFLPVALDSVLEQTRKPDEIIVIDDGSTDGSLEIAQEYEKGGVRVIAQVNKGLASARNTGIMNAASDYILPLDSDDILLPTCVEKILKRFYETNADIVAPSFSTFGAAKQEVVIRTPLGVKDFLEQNRIGYFSAYKRSKALEIGGYSPRMDNIGSGGYEDYHFWIDLLKRGAKLESIEEPLVLYRVKNESMWTQAFEYDSELRAQIRKDHPAAWSA